MQVQKCHTLRHFPTPSPNLQDDLTFLEPSSQLAISWDWLCHSCQEVAKKLQIVHQFLPLLVWDFKSLCNINCSSTKGFPLFLYHFSIGSNPHPLQNVLVLPFLAHQSPGRVVSGNLVGQGYAWAYLPLAFGLQGGHYMSLISLDLPK